MFEIDYIAPDGREWRLHSQGERGEATIIEEGVEGFVGSVEDSVIESVGEPGQILDALNVGVMTGSLQCVLVPDGESIDELFSRWRASWSRRRSGTLRIKSPRLGVLTTAARLSESMPTPEVDPGGKRHARVEVPVVCDRGVWSTDNVRGSGTVTVTNFGDVALWPSVEWAGAGGPVTLPSGATFTLPAAGSKRVLCLNPAESLIVKDLAGKVDRALWLKLAPVAWAEPVMAGETAQFRVPAGAELVWRVSVLDPFGG
ncbi:hypothetical protein [Corynebacterium auriscanis]|uniref:Uncharacterized protein n=1 Tax=Corynebacterium auriscanis TaxID=99807 RepID=A0A0A2DK41_9CORY|nr:hypothetical protein [Corynebacterium auriscanis]KGM18142.1 hypothetical protein MA47_09645 [Corynebacterium auriscanis]WJY73216.1 hypothetical protein CAURIC_08015 [Corynebacterium auriscanis]